jgi:hypothetical protein
MRRSYISPWVRFRCITEIEIYRCDERNEFRSPMTVLATLGKTPLAIRTVRSNGAMGGTMNENIATPPIVLLGIPALFSQAGVWAAEDFPEEMSK